MRKFTGVFAAGIMTASLLAGCGSSAPTSAASVAAAAPAAADAEVSTEASTDADASATENNGSDILVLYFSGTGNTRNVADMIAADTGADEFEITPSEPYTNDDLNYNDKNSRVVREYQDESLQDVAFDSYDIPNWDSYDTIFVGYPIWWMDASWVMKSYVKNVDFTGKTVIPFCTSFSSGLGDSGKNLAELAGTGDWQDGQRFAESASEDDVRSWVDSLGF